MIEQTERTEFTMSMALGVERHQPERFPFEQWAAIRKAGNLSPLREALYDEMRSVSSDIESVRKEITSRAKSAQDEMLRLVVAMTRGENRVHYTGWADSLKELTEKLYQLDARFDALERLMERSDVVVVSEATAAPFTEKLSGMAKRYRAIESEGNEKQAGGRNAAVRDEGRVQAIRNGAKADVLELLLKDQGV